MTDEERAEALRYSESLLKANWVMGSDPHDRAAFGRRFVSAGTSAYGAEGPVCTHGCTSPVSIRSPDGRTLVWQSRFVAEKTLNLACAGGDIGHLLFVNLGFVRQHPTREFLESVVIRVVALPLAVIFNCVLRG